MSSNARGRTDACSILRAASFFICDGRIAEAPVPELITTIASALIESESAAEVNSTAVTLQTQINPLGHDTTYYFQYGTGGHYSHRSRVMRLAAGTSSRHVALTIAGLSGGRTYRYRLVATGKYGHATGLGLKFKAATATK